MIGQQQFLIFMMVIFSLGSHLYSQENPAAIQLPLSWYQMPEDSNTNRELISYEPLNQRVSAQLGNLLQTHASAWDQLAQRDRYQLLSRSTEGRTPWHLEYLALDIGASLQGMVGVLFLRGESLLNVYWRRHHSRKAQAQPTDSMLEETHSDQNTLVFNTWIPPQELKERLEPIVQSVLATRRIKDEAAFRANLWSKAYLFDAMAQALALQQADRWEAARLRLDLEVSAAGMVAPATNVGGSVKIRFDWFPTSTHSRRTPPMDREARGMADNFKQFLDALSREMRDIELEKYPAPAPLHLNMVLFTLAISANGKFGVVSVGGSVAGNLYMRRVATPKWVHAIVPSNEPLTLIGGEATQTQTAYAVSHAIRMRNERSSSLVSTIFALPEGALKRGLEKAHQMGVALAQSALDNQGKSWDVDSVRVQFGLSIGGTAVVVTVVGRAAIQFIYNV